MSKEFDLIERGIEDLLKDLELSSEEIIELLEDRTFGVRLRRALMCQTNVKDDDYDYK